MLLKMLAGKVNCSLRCILSRKRKLSIGLPTSETNRNGVGIIGYEWVPRQREERDAEYKGKRQEECDG